MNPEIIKHILGGYPPVLDCVNVRSINILPGGDLICSINFDLKEMPEKIPEKWKKSNHDAVNISITFIAAKILWCALGENDMIGDIKISFQDEEFEMLFINDAKEVLFKITSSWLNIDKISSYKVIA